MAVIQNLPKKKILLSAFACAPHIGSEAGVGWHWATELAKDYQVFVITDIIWKEPIEAELRKLTLPNLNVEYFRPSLLRSLPIYATALQFMYTIWQFYLLGYAKRLHEKHHFDLAIHITYGVFRQPSFLGFLNIPFIFGPVGGGEDTHLSLKKSIRGNEKIKEILRTVLNKIALIDPLLWLALSKCNFILTKTEETRRALPWPFRKNARLFPEIGIYAPMDVKVNVRRPGAPLKVLFAGRLLGWKGAHFAIRAVALACKKKVPAELTIVGSGPYELELHRCARQLEMDDKIIWKSHLPQPKLFKLYKDSHCFLFPSLHDSSGNVVLEAQAFACPVVCLDIGGPPTLVTPNSAIVISTNRADEDVIVNRMANALITLYKDEERRQAMGKAGLENVRNATWRRRIDQCLNLVFS